MRRLRSLIVAGLLGLAGTNGALAAESVVPPHQEWAHGGVNSFLSMFKTFDYAAAQRGFQVYKEVCSACHSMDLVAYRNLTGIGFTEEQVKAIAAQYEIQDGPNDQGEMFTRPGLPADHFKKPFPNVQAAAAANGGKAPPDLSLMVKAREHFEDYVYAILTGYGEAPADHPIPDGTYYNTYFPGHAIKMPAPLFEDGVTYADGTKATIAQQAHDVVTFLAWAAEPHLVDRRSTGVKVILFLVVFAGIMYAAKRRVWADVH